MRECDKIVAINAAARNKNTTYGKFIARATSEEIKEAYIRYEEQREKHQKTIKALAKKKYKI